jgi:hypothetical protein
MPTSIQLLLIAFGIYVATRSILDGMIISTPAFGFWIADGLTADIAIPLFLLSCFVFGAVLLVRMKDDRYTKAKPK